MNAKLDKGLRIGLFLLILLVSLGLDRPKGVYAAAPSHDDFINAKVIDSITYVDLNVDVREATPQYNPLNNTVVIPGDGSDPDNVGPCVGTNPPRALNVGSNTVWYKYTPNTTESISVDTTGSNYDTYIAVWTGTPGSLNLVKCNDEDDNGYSTLSFIANTGITYYIQVAQYNGYYGENYNPPTTTGILQFHVYITNLNVSVGTSLQNNYYLYNASVLTDYYPSLLDGPVKVTSSIGENIFTSQRVTSGDSYNELMGFPANQLTTEYWFPYYDHGYPNVVGSNMRTWILVGNASNTLSANVQIYIGGVLRHSETIAPGSRITPRWIGLQSGPVRVVSTNGVPIFTSQRVFTSTNNAFDEKLGYPANQFTTEYWFPWYDDKNMTNHILVGNTSSSQAASVQIFIAGILRGTYTVPANGVLQQRYPGLIGGPVQVRSTNGVNIVASQKSVSGLQRSYNEVMGYPFNQFTTTYWFPWYDHGYPSVIGSNMRTWILVGNPSTTQTANVQIYIGGILQTVPGSTPPTTTFTIPPRGNVTPRWIGLQGGPVQVVSDIPIFASERVFTVPNSVFNEAMGIPGNQLTSEYWYPWYDSQNMNNFLLISKP
ncbi:MAG: hypothetical protein AB1509_07530 [Chloroflexota bacterium]